jgi:hypothetical protein
VLVVAYHYVTSYRRQGRYIAVAERLSRRM